MGDLTWEPNIDDRSTKIVPRNHNVESAREGELADHRLVEPEWVQNAVELDGIGIVRIVQMDVDVTVDEYRTAVAWMWALRRTQGDRPGPVDGQRDDVWMRELEHGQHEFESARNEVVWNSFRTNAIPVD